MKNSKAKYIIITGYNKKLSKLYSLIEKQDDRLVKMEEAPARLIVADDFNAKIREEQRVSDCGLDKELEICKRKSKNEQVRSEGELLLRWRMDRAMNLMDEPGMKKEK